MLCVVIDCQEPAKGVPNIPTASSAQTKNKANKITPQIIILFVKLFIRLNTSSHSNPVTSSKIPIIKKSAILQLISFVNCIATNGVNKRISADNRIAINLLFFIGINLMTKSINFCFLNQLFNSNFVYYEPYYSGNYQK